MKFTSLYKRFRWVYKALKSYGNKLSNFSFFLQEDGQGSAKVKASSTTEYVVTGTLNDRSILSDEMADLCAKFPIYLIKEKSLGVGVEHLQRK